MRSGTGVMSGHSVIARYGRAPRRGVLIVERGAENYQCFRVSAAAHYLQQGGARFGIGGRRVRGEHVLNARRIGAPEHRAKALGGFGTIAGLDGSDDERDHGCDVTGRPGVFQGAQRFAPHVGVGVSGHFHELWRGGGASSFAGGADQFEPGFGSAPASPSTIA